MQPKPAIELPAVRSWEALGTLRESLARHLAALGLPDSLQEALTLVALELAENGVNYGAPDATGGRVRLTLRPTPRWVEICACSRPPDPHVAQGVLARVAKLQASEDNYQAYVDRLLELAQRPGGPRSGLGFHRIVVEGRCTLRAQYDGQSLTICARRPL